MGMADLSERSAGPVNVDDFIDVDIDDSASQKSSTSTRSSLSSRRSKSKKSKSIKPAPFSALFQFATSKDKMLFGIGIFFSICSALTMPAINIIFGEIIDAIANPINVKDITMRGVYGMLILGGYGFVTFFLSFVFCGYASTNIANGYRMKYLEALLVQDMTFFDNAEPGSLTMMLSDSAMAIQSGISEKFVQAVQGFFQFIFGFAIAFAFGPILSLVVLGCVPVLAIITMGMFMWGSEDGIFGKEAYEEASAIANEAMSNIRTVVSLNAETTMSKRYDSKLGESERASIRQGTRTALLGGALFFVMFAMYGLGFWYGAVLIAESTDEAMQEHPAPDNLLDNLEWLSYITYICSDYMTDTTFIANNVTMTVDAFTAKMDEAANFAAISNMTEIDTLKMLLSMDISVDTSMMSERALEALQVCACGFIPWHSIVDPYPITGPNCGCGYGKQVDLGLEVWSGCVSGGRTIMVFFSILIGGFSIGQIGPGVKALADARIAAAKILAVINRKPKIGCDIDDDDDDDDEFGKSNSTDNEDIKTNAEKSNPKTPPSTPTSPQPRRRLKRENVRGEIVFENLHFKYRGSHPKPEGDEENTDGQHPNLNATAADEKSDDGHHGPKVVFRGCELTMKAGETVALVGESGCGKSTIAKLVQRFYDPTRGRILLDGVDLREFNVRDLRSCIGVVSQEPLLFDTSIEDNIRYGKPNATQEEIVNAAKSANAHDFIMGLPDGYQTVVGPKGGKLSGGQKQRVAISRAILRDPPILILDEATSALDNKSEKLVQQALDKLIKHEDNTSTARSRTIIVIAHRLSTVRNADTIVVLGSPEGTSTAATGSIILEQGKHDDLMQLEHGYYRALVGAGNKSKAGLVDDDEANKFGDTINTEAMLEEFDTAPVAGEEIPNNKDVLASSTESAVEKVSFWDSIKKSFGGKDPDKAAKEEEEKKKLTRNKARVWNYTKPEMGLIIFGSIASFGKGTILPLFSLVFSEMISIWYVSDTTKLLERSLEYSYIFYGISVACMIGEGIQKGVFEMIGERLTKRMRGDLFRSILSKDITWFEDDTNAIGILTSRLSTDVKLVRLVTGQSIASALEATSALLTGIIIAATASWEMFLIMLAMVPALGLAEGLQFVALGSSEGKIREELSKSTDKLHETVYAIREVQSYSLQKLFINDIENRIKETIVPASQKSAIGKGLMMGMIQIIEFCVYAFAFWFGGHLIDQGRIDFDSFNRALWAMAFASTGLGQAALFGGDAAKAAAAVTSIFDTLDFMPIIKSEPWENNGIADKKTLQATTRPLPNSTIQYGKGTLSKVNFAYPTRKTARVFDHIDLQIPAGKVVAIVGSSGSGKSTVVQLLLRFYDPVSYKDEGEESKGGVEEAQALDIVIDDGKLKTTDGIVKIDEKDIREEDCRWLRGNMGYVGQEPVLFDDTIYNNISIGKENSTRAEVEAAARHANAYEFITSLEDGFDTMVGVGGGKVSGGQKQRIAIARAIIGNPKILILDEATSALDNESEKIVQESLDALMKDSNTKRTTIVIAHRLSTIKNADCICVLENSGDGSRVVEMGTHQELLKLGQKYKALVQAYENH